MIAIKRIVTCLVVLILFSSGIITVFAEENETGLITGDNLNVREEPNLNATIISMLSKGITVEIIEKTDDWYNINHEEVNGWIYGGYVQVNVKGIINAYTVNVRKAPILGAEVITQLDKGIEVTVYKKEGNWYNIELPDGKSGWVYGTLLTVDDSKVSRSGSLGVREISNIRTEIIEYAKRFLGVKYVYGGSTPNGFDCSGFVQYVLKNFDININRVAADQAKQGTWLEKSDLLPGDLVFFDTNGGHNYINHVGMYIGGGNFIHASSGSSNKKVVISDLSGGFYANAYMTGRRFIND